MSRSQYAQVPQETAEEEMYAAFDNGDDDDNLDDDGHHPSQPLLSSHRQDSSWHPLDSSTDNLHRNTDTTVLFDSSNPTTPPTHTSNRSVGGTYDFEYDYASMPPPGSPPELHLAQPNAYGNSNGLVPNAPPLIVSGARPPNFLSRALGAILPTHYAHDRRGGGLGNDGVFGNVVAKPVGAHPAGSNGEDGHQTGPYEVPEFAQKDAPPVRIITPQSPASDPCFCCDVSLADSDALSSHTTLLKPMPYRHTGRTPYWRQADP